MSSKSLEIDSHSNILVLNEELLRLKKRESRINIFNIIIGILITGVVSYYTYRSGQDSAASLDKIKDLNSLMSQTLLQIQLLNQKQVDNTQSLITLNGLMSSTLLETQNNTQLLVQINSQNKQINMNQFTGSVMSNYGISNNNADYVRTKIITTDGFVCSSIYEFHTNDVKYRTRHSISVNVATDITYVKVITCSGLQYKVLGTQYFCAFGTTGPPTGYCSHYIGFGLNDSKVISIAGYSNVNAPACLISNTVSISKSVTMILGLANIECVVMDT